jgi:hypothetical protein
MTFNDKYDFKNAIRKIASDFEINQDMFDKIFGNVFMDIFEREQMAACILNRFNVSLCQQIFADVKTVKKSNKENFLLLFEDYQKISNELAELDVKIKMVCYDNNGKCKNVQDCKVNIKHYPLIFNFIERKDLQEFHPDLIPSKAFLELIEQNMDKPGLCFLYNRNKELLHIKKATNLGAKIVDSVWETNADGYIALAITIKVDDIHLYEPYYKLMLKPLLETDIIACKENLSISLEPLEISALVKIYDNN